MRSLTTSLCLMISVCVTAARAEDDAPKNEDRASRRAEMRQKMLEEFDADGDGELTDDERTKAREAMRSRRQDKAKGGKAQGGKAGKGRRGPGGPPNPAELFDRFDADGDGQLSRAEFMQLHESRPRPPCRCGEGSRGEGRGNKGRRGGPRPEGQSPEGRRRRNFDQQGPLQNRGDRSGPPPSRRGEGRRQMRDEDSPRGFEGRGHRPPRPEEVFERFDGNGDDQLSRAEFMELVEWMHQIRGHGKQEGRMRGTRGRGGERGAGSRREEGPPRGRRPGRPEMESESSFEIPADDSNSI